MQLVQFVNVIFLVIGPTLDPLPYALHPDTHNVENYDIFMYYTIMSVSVLVRTLACCAFIFTNKSIHAQRPHCAPLAVVRIVIESQEQPGNSWKETLSPW